MPRKPQPRKNWGYGVCTLSKYDHIRIAQAAKYPLKLGIELTAELETELRSAISCFVADTTQFADPPRQREIKAALERVVKCSDNFVDALIHTDAATDRLLAWEGVPFTEAYLTKKADLWSVTVPEAMPSLKVFSPLIRKKQLN
jgi:hypothetical protein